MLISKVDNDAGPQTVEMEDHLHDYQTASELFDLMARDHDFENHGDDLTTRDLVILYENIDIGTKLMSNANDYTKVRKPNQRVESIVYADDADSDGSETSNIYTEDDIKTVFKNNKERIDLLNNRSYENTLCHKLGDLQIQASQLSTEYEKHFLFQDLYIKQQLKSMKMKSRGNESMEPIFPTTLLDYICCKRLEDNYNFYMDNIIRYVKHTIEQLKRISNGDYLTDRAKEMWKEVHNQNDLHTKVLAASTSIPLHVERKSSGQVSTWEDIVHSEIDVRSLSKILEKKIVLEVPKLICGTYKLFSERRAENLIISCEREKSKSLGEDSNSRVDVVLQLQRSESGQVISNISSIMILQATNTIPEESKSLEPPTLPFIKKEEEEVCNEHKVKIVEIDKNDCTSFTNCENEVSKETKEGNHNTPDSRVQDNEYTFSDNEENTPRSNGKSSDSSNALQNEFDSKEMSITKTLNTLSPTNLSLTLQRLNMQTTLTEESGEDLSSRVHLPSPKKKSPTRIRIKSPYENKTHVLEEKKRRKLLEIRERRERRKMILGENSKINKHYGRSATMPQPSTSVTKLSITNKSFYNSIYGQNLPLNTKSTKGKPKSLKKEIIPEIPMNDNEDEYEQSFDTPNKNSKKFINRGYYLDEAETEMMYLKTKQNNGDLKDIGSASTSVVSNDFRVNLTLLSQLIGPSDTDLESNKACALSHKSSIREDELQKEEDKKCLLDSIMTRSSTNVVPVNTLKDMELNDYKQPKKTSSAAECRASIDQIYDLMKQFKKTNSSDVSKSRGEMSEMNSDKVVVIAARGSSTMQGSDSGTSLKHYQTSSFPSCFSFDKTGVDGTKKQTNPNNKPEPPTAVIPKVIINSKLQTSTSDKLKKDKRVVINPTIKIRENPLKAISQLLHEFENVQKTRQKCVEAKAPKKMEVPLVENKNTRLNNILRRSRVDQNRDTDVDGFKKLVIPLKQKKARPSPIEVSKLSHNHIAVEDKRENVFRKKLSDIIDQEKEARGEAVRGPSKFPSRLNALAQPKRAYVQAHSEEYHSKYGRNLVADRLQRLASYSVPTKRPFGSADSKNKIKKPEAMSTVSVKKSLPVPPLGRLRCSVTNPIDKPMATTGVASPYKHNVSDAPVNLKKMVAVESYVNNHYGRAPAVDDTPQNVQKSRVPLLPSDIGLGSELSNSNQEESNVLGSKLHRIIDMMINDHPPGLAVLSEDLETTLQFSKMKTEESPTDSLSKDIERISTNSDYPIDILRDQIVETVVNDPENLKTKEDNVFDAIQTVQYGIQASNSSIELDKLEKALYRRMSVGTFQKRLRIKKLTLTPKQSMQQIFAVQSGDAGTSLVKATISHVKLNKSSGSLCEIKSLEVISKTHIDWRFSNLPTQITTVGYAFPKYEKPHSACRPKIVSVNDISNTKDKNDPCHLIMSKSVEISKYSKDVAHTAEKEKCIQVDLLHSNIGLNNDDDTGAHEKIGSNLVAISSNNLKMPFLNTTEHKKVIESPTNEKTNELFDDIDYTTSLDVLVGLLSEIQKITSCQTQIAEAKNESTQNRELEIILNNAAKLETSTSCRSHDPTCIDKMKQIESSTSLYTYFMSKNANENEEVNSTCIMNTVKDLKPITVDKEVSVNISDRECVSKFTDIPSQLFPVTFNHSTNVTNSLIGVLSQPSSQSMFSFTEHQTCALSIFENNIELPKLRKVQEVDSELSLIPYNTMQREANEKLCIELYTADTVKKINNNKSLLNQQLLKVSKEKGNEDFDATLKMKRDILVAVYSILVLTVFAALSFPEIMYNV